MIKDFLERATKGESVFICDVRDAFSTADTSVGCMIETAAGEIHRWNIPLPQTGSTEEKAFVRDYFYANVYNLISTLGGKFMALYINPEDTHIEELCVSLDDVFQTALPRDKRTGYGKCLNVTDRVNAALGCPPFRFKIAHGQWDNKAPEAKTQQNAVSIYKKAVEAAQSVTLCGLDIGGTDIKAVGSVNGRIAAIKEYDWNPAEMTAVEQMLEPILLITRVILTVLSLPDSDRGKKLRAALLNKDNSDEEMLAALDTAKAFFGEPTLLDGIGVNFPDVVIHNKIVGGETPKTTGMREFSRDYESEFRRFLELNGMLLGYCKPGGVLSMSNDGNVAAYTAAVELAHTDKAETVADGVLAHTLGTEIGTGWVNENGDIPQIPLEVYNWIIDLGNYPARNYDAFDVRSIRNSNTGIDGTLQRCSGQSSVFRLAYKYFTENAPELCKGLSEKGLIAEEGKRVYVPVSPDDMRKALLEHIMELADNGVLQAERVMREVGRCLAATWRETGFILDPRTKQRILYGRFVKRVKCFDLIREGAREMRDIKFIPGDDDLAFTPLMQDLKADENHTVAQFGQAVGAVYFAASAL